MFDIEVRSAVLDAGSSPGALLRGAPQGSMMAPPSDAFQSDVSAQCMLVAALSPAGRIDFPTVTDICERVLGSDSQAEAVANTLALALRRGALEEDVSLLVKALTVANELLFDAHARRAMFNERGFLKTLLEIRNSRTAQVDDPSAECARLFAWEVSKQLLKEFCCKL